MAGNSYLSFDRLVEWIFMPLCAITLNEHRAPEHRNDWKITKMEQVSILMVFVHRHGESESNKKCKRKKSQIDSFNVIHHRNILDASFSFSSSSLCCVCVCSRLTMITTLNRVPSICVYLFCAALASFVPDTLDSCRSVHTWTVFLVILPVDVRFVWWNEKQKSLKPKNADAVRAVCLCAHHVFFPWCFFFVFCFFGCASCFSCSFSFQFNSIMPDNMLFDVVWSMLLCTLYATAARRRKIQVHCWINATIPWTGQRARLHKFTCQCIN